MSEGATGKRDEIETPSGEGQECKSIMCEIHSEVAKTWYKEWTIRFNCSQSILQKT